jgi:DNA adenine methylase
MNSAKVASVLTSILRSDPTMAPKTAAFLPGFDAEASHHAPDAPAAPFAWFGGKSYYAPWIISHFPEHRVYVEPFGGAANVLLAKRPSPVEIYNDLDGRVVNFFRVIRERDSFEELCRRSLLTPYSREEFTRLVVMPEPTDPVGRAWRFFVLCRQARGGIGMSDLTPAAWSTAWRVRRGMAEGPSKYLSAIDGLEEVAARFHTVMIEHRPALEVIAQYDGPDTLHYLDPPYLPSVRHGGRAATYAVEMTIEDHERLLEAVGRCQGKVMISGYPSVLYDAALASWHRVETHGKAHMANSGQGRTEVLWMNW